MICRAETMNDNERASVKELLTLARIAILAMLAIGGYISSEVILGVI